MHNNDKQQTTLQNEHARLLTSAVSWINQNEAQTCILMSYAFRDDNCSVKQVCWKISLMLPFGNVNMLLNGTTGSIHLLKNSLLEMNRCYILPPVDTAANAINESDVNNQLRSQMLNVSESAITKLSSCILCRLCPVMHACQCLDPVDLHGWLFFCDLNAHLQADVILAQKNWHQRAAESHRPDQQAFVTYFTTKPINHHIAARDSEVANDMVHNAWDDMMLTADPDVTARNCIVLRHDNSI